MLHRYAAIAAVALLAACVTTSPSGFLSPDGGAVPVRGAEAPPDARIALSGAAERTVIVYNHGTSRPQRVEDCRRWYNAVPGTVASLEEQPGWHIYYLCSKATDTVGRGSYIDNRRAEIEGVLDGLLAAGVPSRRIFLAGHSAGAWSSLMAMDLVGQKFNAAVLFAPACCGRRSEVSMYPEWRTEVRPAHVARIKAIPDVRALVFAFSDDAFNRKQELQFLEDAFPGGVEIVEPACGVVHADHVRGCGSDAAVTDKIRRYLTARLGQPTS